MKFVPPVRGEFGMRLRYHVPRVHAMPGPKVVACELGEEALYPSATALHIVGVPHDDDRRGLHVRGEDFVVPEGFEPAPTRDGMPEAWFVPEAPHFWASPVDVVVCPRRRAYGSSKNWDAWPEVAERLHMRTCTFAAGLSSTSYPVPALDIAWQWGRPLDATIAAMRDCALVVATSSGLACLAMLCGAPLLLVTYRGLVAPGPQVDAKGRVLQASYGPAPIDTMLRPMNHLNAPIYEIDGWEHPERVVERALELVG